MRLVCERVEDPEFAARFLARYIEGLTHKAEPVPLVPVSEVMALLKIVHRCLYRSTEGCGCSGARCALAGRIVGPHDCLECVRTYGDS